MRDPGGAAIGLGGVVAQGPHGETQEGTAVMHDSCSRLSGRQALVVAVLMNQRLKSECGKSARYVLWEPGAGDRLRDPVGAG